MAAKKKPVRVRAKAAVLKSSAQESALSFEALSLKDIQAAQAELSRYLSPTPLLLNPWLSERYRCQVYLKLENMQPIGSFKIRGATLRILKLSESERKRGVIAASAGNHAQGVAWGSRLLGVDALIVMPKGAPIMKVQNTQALGAKIQLEGENYDEAYKVAQTIAQKTGRVFVHAYEDPHVIAGQGTVGLEILRDLPDVHTIVSSMGGGGLMAGVAMAVKAINPKVRVVGVQASGASALVHSIRKHRRVDSSAPKTFADGVAVAKTSPKIFDLLDPRLDGAYDADDESIAAAILMLMEKAKVVAEGAGAIPLAVLDRSVELQRKVRGKKIVLIVSGGNIDVNVLSRVIDRGLIQAGRRLRLNVLISDRPGSLNKLTYLLAGKGANVVQAIHDRNEPSTKIDETEVALTLETRGPEHSAELIKALRDHVLRLEIAH